MAIDTVIIGKNDLNLSLLLHVGYGVIHLCKVHKNGKLMCIPKSTKICFMRQWLLMYTIRVQSAY